MLCCLKIHPRKEVVKRRKQKIFDAVVEHPQFDALIINKRPTNAIVRICRLDAIPNESQSHFLGFGIEKLSCALTTKTATNKM